MIAGHVRMFLQFFNHERKYCILKQSLSLKIINNLGQTILVLILIMFGKVPSTYAPLF